MRKIKKILSLLIALSMVCSFIMPISAFAEDDDGEKIPVSEETTYIQEIGTDESAEDVEGTESNDSEDTMDLSDTETDDPSDQDEPSGTEGTIDPDPEDTPAPEEETNDPEPADEPGDEQPDPELPEAPAESPEPNPEETEDNPDPSSNPGDEESEIIPTQNENDLMQDEDDYGEDGEDGEDEELGEEEDPEGPRHELTEGFTTGTLTLNSLNLPTCLADVARKEFAAEDSIETPLYSDSIKYNDWFYGHRVCNPYVDGEYLEEYNWNTVFVSWCAEQLGYIDFGHFLKTNDSSELLQWFLENNFTWIRKSDIFPGDEEPVLRESDLIFIPDDDFNYCVGIVTKVTRSYIKYIAGDYNCGLAEFRLIYEEVPDMTSFIRLDDETIRDDALYVIARFLCREVGLTPTAACGFLANMYYESMFNPTALGDAMTSYGLCQWHDYRWDRLVEFCEINDYNWQTAEGQLRYLKYELENYYRDLLEVINQCEDSASGAYEAAFYICVDFEQPENANIKGENRGYLAFYSVYPALIRQY